MLKKTVTTKNVWAFVISVKKVKNCVLGTDALNVGNTSVRNIRKNCLFHLYIQKANLQNKKQVQKFCGKLIVFEISLFLLKSAENIFHFAQSQLCCCMKSVFKSYQVEKLEKKFLRVTSALSLSPNTTNRSV